MSRSRSISTEISTDERLGPLGEENPLCVLLYTLAIPHADDWGRLKGDATAFRYEVAPFLLMPASQIDAALDSIAAAGLWVRYEVDGRKFIAFPRDTWFKHQNYIGTEKRTHDGSKYPAPQGEVWVSWESRPSNQRNRRESPKNAENPRESPQNPSSPSPSPSPTPTPSVIPLTPVEQETQITTTTNGKVFSECGPLPTNTKNYLLETCPDWWEAHLRLALSGRQFTNTAALDSYAMQILRGWKKGKDTPQAPLPKLPTNPSGPVSDPNADYRRMRREIAQRNREAQQAQELHPSQVSEVSH